MSGYCWPLAAPTFSFHAGRTSSSAPLSQAFSSAPRYMSCASRSVRCTGHHLLRLLKILDRWPSACPKRTAQLWVKLDISKPFGVAFGTGKFPTYFINEYVLCPRNSIELKVSGRTLTVSVVNSSKSYDTIEHISNYAAFFAAFSNNS